MPFKIVQTRESNHILLSVVPDRWELDGKLKWPKSSEIKIKKSAFTAMQRDENTVPGDNWTAIKCRLKRQCPTYDEAVAQSKVMSDNSDTSDASDAMPPPTFLPAKRKIVNRMRIARAPATDFNDVVSVIFHREVFWIVCTVLILFFRHFSS